ncbi:MAG: helicase-related protein [Gaiellaceae bacterium]
MTRPDVLDNLRRDHADGLAYLVGDLGGRALSVATGYVDLGGLHHLATVLDEDEREVRLLLGAIPQPGLGAELPNIAFETQLAFLEGERDFSRFPPSRAAERLHAVEQWLSSGRVEVRRYVQRFLHGKAYLFGSEEDPRAALVTSANLTGAGLERNLELGIVDYNPAPSRAAIRWFDGLWEQAAPFADELRELLFPALGLVDAQTVYLRALAELYGAEVETKPAGEIVAVHLASFQRDGYERARRILQRHGGVVYADGVGTGKTEVGLAFIEEYALEQGRLALVVCPAQLKDNWAKRIAATLLPAQVFSYNELATDEQLNPEASRPRRHLPVDKDAYRLVVVDEAHALRNEDTTWHAAMNRLLGGEPKHAVFLSATPVNNTLWDLYNLVMLFARHDRAFAPIGIPSAKRLFLNAGANERDPESLAPELLFPLADAVSVRRDRRFIQEHYPSATFPDGTPVRFPEPRPETRRYDLDEAHPGFFAQITGRIAKLEMARYRPTRWLLEEAEDPAEGQLGALLQSQLLKRFESCWAACLATVERMIAAHDAFLLAWDDGRGVVPSKETLRQAAHVEGGETGLAGWLEEELSADSELRPAGEFDPEYGAIVAQDREHLVAIRDLLASLSPETDPKLRLLRELLEQSPAQKIAVFATYGETIRYLDEHLPERIGGRERVMVIGGESEPDERTRLIARFAPDTVVEPGYKPPDGEVDLLLSTDVMSEGQNLQQAQAVISYDMPWNPQRVVQRNGRVIRLLSPHEEVFLTTMLPEPGELEELLRIETVVRRKIRAAGVFGMEVEVIEGVEVGLRAYAERLEAGELEALEAEDEEALSGAFLGEQLRALVMRAFEEGELQRILALPWGIGAVVRQTPAAAARGRAGVFFATRTRPPDDYRYWRFVELGDDGELLDSELPILRRIDPTGLPEAELGEVDLESAWLRAVEDIVRVHNERADPRAAEAAIGPAQRWALTLLRDPSVILPEGAEEAAAALEVERSGAVRRALNEIRAELSEERVSPNEAAAQVVALVRRLGLRAVEAEEAPEPITEDDVGVVCWLAVLPPN